MIKLLRRLHRGPKTEESGDAVAVADPVAERYAFDSGERQTASELDGIRGDHVYRYETAISVIGENVDQLQNGFVLDAFCGNGYGTHMLCRRLGCCGLGIDASEGAIACADAHYGSARTLFCRKEFPFDLPKETFDAATCLESLEHVEDVESLMNTICGSLKPGGVVFVSTPNERLFPHDSENHLFHVRHYRHEEVIDLFSRIDGDFRLLQWYGQDVYNTAGDDVTENCWGVEPQQEKQILMFAFQKGT